MEKRSLLPADSILDPRIFATVTLIVIQLSLLVSISLTGGADAWADAAALARYGALVRARVWDDQEYWRLVSAMFLHGGLFHFLLNAVCLFFFGGRVEVALGRWRYLALYMASGLTGNLASLLWGNPLGLSMGASGAIFGVVVAYLMAEGLRHTRWSDMVRQPGVRFLFFLIGFELALGFFIPQIDSLAHLGGALTGAALGWFFTAPLRRRPVGAAGRWLPPVLWAAAFCAMSAVAAKPPASAQSHTHLAFYYLAVEDDIAKALAHFDAATTRDPSRAVREIDHLTRRYVAQQPRFLFVATLLDFLDADRAALDYYRAQAADKPSTTTLRLVVVLAQKSDVADCAGALAACAEGKKRFGEKSYWDLVEAGVHANFRWFDKALAVLADLEGTSEALTADYWEVVARCHLRRHDWQPAEQATSRCLAAFWLDLPKTDPPGRRLAVKDWRLRALTELGRTPEAQTLRADMEKQWRRHAFQAPQDAAALNNLAWFLAMHGGDLDESSRLITLSIELLADGFNLDTLAWIEHLRGNPHAAWKAIERALAGRRANSPEFHYHAGAILHSLGRDGEARQYLKRAIEPSVDFDDFENAEKLLADLKSMASVPKNAGPE